MDGKNAKKSRTQAVGQARTVEAKYPAAPAPLIDVSKHVAPKYTIEGYPISQTKQLTGRRLDESLSTTKIPLTWSQKGSKREEPGVIKTKRALEAERFRQKIPHPSFDLDGDG